MIAMYPPLGLFIQDVIKQLLLHKVSSKEQVSYILPAPLSFPFLNLRKGTFFIAVYTAVGGGNL